MADVRTILALENLPDRWLSGDDKCDCTYQRIGSWHNPYIGTTLQVRLCCLWAEIYKEYPDFVQEIPAFWDGNHVAPVTGPQPWDSEDMDMPLPIWYRQLAREQGRSVADIRAEYQHKQHLRPRKVSPGSGRESRQPSQREVRLAQLDELEKTGWRREDRIALWEKEDTATAQVRREERLRAQGR